MSQDGKIEGFLGAIRERLNRRRLYNTLIVSVAVGGGALLLVTLIWVLRGYAAPKWAYLLAPFAIGGGAAAYWWWRRSSERDAAHYADRYFGLKDSLTSWLDFRSHHRQGELFELQEAAAEATVDGLDATKVTWEWPRRMVWTAGLVTMGCVLLAFKEPSPQVLAAEREAAETEAKSEEINKHLEELVEELEKSLDPEMEKLIEPNKLREFVDKLKTTDDRKDAMRQYAELERKLQEAAQKLEQRKNEQIMAKAAEELRKDSETKALGKTLEEKNYRQAAQDVAKMTPEENAKPISEQRKELARLKAAAQRMAAAAVAANRQGSTASQKSGAQNASSSQSGSNPSKGSGQQNGQSGESGTPGSQDEEGLEQMLAELDESVKDLDQALKNAEQDPSDQSKNKCQACQSAVKSNLDKLSKCLSKMASKKECQSRIASLCKNLGQCQGYLNGQCQSPNAGGKMAGSGSVESRRDALDEVVDNGNTTQLQGIKGAGPSQTSVEAADDGDGVSTRASAVKERGFARQMESFVRREDVPDDLKEGVKEYFKSIHQAQPQPAAP